MTTQQTFDLERPVFSALSDDPHAQAALGYLKSKGYQVSYDQQDLKGYIIVALVTSWTKTPVDMVAHPHIQALYNHLGTPFIVTLSSHCLRKHLLRGMARRYTRFVDDQLYQLSIFQNRGWKDPNEDYLLEAHNTWQSLEQVDAPWGAFQKSYGNDSSIGLWEKYMREAFLTTARHIEKPTAS